MNYRRVVHLTMHTYLTRLFVLGTSFVSNVLLARLLGPEGKGYIATATLWSAIIASILAFGLDSAAIYFIGKAHGRSHRLAAFFAAYASTAAWVGAFALFFFSQVSVILASQPRLVFATGLLIWTTLAVALFNALYIGLGRLVFVNWVAALGAIAYLAALIVFSFMGERTVWPVLWSVVAIQGVSAIWMMIRARAVPRSEEMPIFRQEFVTYAFKSYVGNLAGLLYGRISFVVLSMTVTPSEVGIYSMALVFADLILVLPTALINILLPTVAALPRAEAISRVSIATRYSFGLALLMALGVCLISVFLVPFALGESFRPAVGMIWVLSAGAWIAAGSMCLSIYFNGTNKPEIPSSAAWLGTLLAVVLSLILARTWGGYGAAASLGIARVVVGIYLLNRYLGDTHERLSNVVLLHPADLLYGIRLLRGVRT